MRRWLSRWLHGIRVGLKRSFAVELRWGWAAIYVLASRTSEDLAEVTAAILSVSGSWRSEVPTAPRGQRITSFESDSYGSTERTRW
jgi:hypothetical protein